MLNLELSANTNAAATADQQLADWRTVAAGASEPVQYDLLHARSAWVNSEATTRALGGVAGLVLELPQDAQ